MRYGADVGRELRCVVGDGVDDRRVVGKIAYGRPWSREGLDRAEVLGLDLMEREDGRDALFGAGLVRIVRVERELAECARRTSP